MWRIDLPAHEQDAFAETLDAAVAAQDDSEMTAQEKVLRDYLVLLAKDVVDAAPIVAERICATISGQANDGGNVWVGGNGTIAPGLVLAISAAP